MQEGLTKRQAGDKDAFLPKPVLYFFCGIVIISFKFHDPPNPRQELLQLEEHVAGCSCKFHTTKLGDPFVDALWSYFAVSFEIF